MSGTWDATILSAYAAEPGGPFAVDAVGNGEKFDVVANLRIGRNLMQFVDRCELFVSVRNLSRSTTMLSQHQQHTLAPRSWPSTRPSGRSSRRGGPPKRATCSRCWPPSR